MWTAGAKELAAEAAEHLKYRCGADSYEAVVVLGSGWSGAAESLGLSDIELDMSELPGFVAPRATGHSPKVRSMWVGTKRIAVFLGRTHLYEGHGAMQVAHAVRTGIAAGAGVALLTGSAGSLRTDFAVGQPVIVRDHINLTGTSPLLGPDFVDLSNAYAPWLRDVAREADEALTEGIYAALPGPQFQTPAELAMLRSAGVDLVGHSLALETIAAVEMGAEVLGLAMVSNDAIGAVFEGVDSEQALSVVQQRARNLGELLNRVLLRV
ncbi:purine-nucleoside phosphorylase [Allosalinactinospora lopnorensis]|uniref:purine-nucleoside phosphorylase n=1 Tax=Allosalinactinospora lopnorensis TaxID=1352348 RepID=UPI0009E53254|nr:purine-nucleoside phosphorylase [Allosalinactinospora lopnorensis]